MQMRGIPLFLLLLQSCFDSASKCHDSSDAPEASKVGSIVHYVQAIGTEGVLSLLISAMLRRYLAFQLLWYLQVNRDGEPMRAKTYKFEILPSRLKLHLPNTKLLSQHKEDSSRDKTESKKQNRRRGVTSPQASFLQRVQSISRPQFEDKGKQKAKGFASSAAKIGLVFGAGGVAGVMAQRRGWFGGTGR